MTSCIKQVLPAMSTPKWVLAASEILVSCVLGGIYEANLWLGDLNVHVCYKFHKLFG